MLSFIECEQYDCMSRLTASLIDFVPSYEMRIILYNYTMYTVWKPVFMHGPSINLWSLFFGAWLGPFKSVTISVTMHNNGERIVLPTRSSSREVRPHYCSDCIKGNVNLLKWIKMISYCTESANYFEWMWTISSISLNSFPIMVWRTINIRLALWIVGTLLHPSKIFNGIKVKIFRQSLESIVCFWLQNVKTKRTFKILEVIEYRSLY